MTRTADFLVIGGGILGLNLALALRRRFAGAGVLLIEKEERCGVHASGRNSGVLHAGFYYSADSLKARFTRAGNAALRRFCRERGLYLDECGKLVVARDEHDLPRLDELLRRARASGVELHRVSAAEARELEPAARTHEAALFSPSSAVVDPRAVMEAHVREAEESGVRVLTGIRYEGRAERGMRTSAGTLSAGFVVNAAGLYADRIARDYGFGERYRILPFRGLYVRSTRPGSFRRHVYPAPDLRYPFLGVHVTVTASGRPKIGPTATPALWREQYAGLANFRLAELAEVCGRELGLLLRNGFDFRRLAARELLKFSRRRLLGEAQPLLARRLRAGEWRWASPGIRAQLVDIRERRLEMDFRYEGDDRSLHVLNSISPGFTCARPLAAFLAEEVERRLAGREAAAPPPEPACRSGAAV